MSLMNAKETAEYMQISYSTFKRNMKLFPQTMPTPVLIGKSKRWLKETVDQFLLNKSHAEVSVTASD